MLSASPSRDAFLLLGPDVLPLGLTDAGCCAPSRDNLEPAAA